MRRACLSLIVSKLLSNNGSKVQLDKMMKIYKVLDKSGDGKISHNEIKSCFKTLEQKETLNDEIYKEICFNVSKKGPGIRPRCKANNEFECTCQNVPHIMFKDFLLCSLDMEYKTFIQYMRQANLIFFNNDTKSIGKCEFTNMLKDDKYVSSRSLHAFIENIDEDKSLTITSQEFFDFMINKLKIIKHGGVMNYKTVEDEF